MAAAPARAPVAAGRRSGGRAGLRFGQPLDVPMPMVLWGAIALALLLVASLVSVGLAVSRLNPPRQAPPPSLLSDRLVLTGAAGAAPKAVPSSPSLICATTLCDSAASGWRLTGLGVDYVCYLPVAEPAVQSCAGSYVSSSPTDIGTLLSNAIKGDTDKHGASFCADGGTGHLHNFFAHAEEDCYSYTASDGRLIPARQRYMFATNGDGTIVYYWTFFSPLGSADSLYNQWEPRAFSDVAVPIDFKLG